MQLGEPAATQGDIRFSLFGIPVRIHPFFWIIGLILGMNSRDVRGMLTWVVVLLVGILFHELGHAFAIRAFGQRPRIVLYGFGGLTFHHDEGVYAASDPGPMRQIIISAAGPGAGFLLAAAVVAGIALSGHAIEFGLGGSFGIVIRMQPVGSPLFTAFLWQLLYFCLIWGAVNLLPVYPLDGGQIGREILVWFNPEKGIVHSLILSIFTAILLAVYGLAVLRDPFIAVLFGYLAYSSFSTLQAYQNRRGPW